MAKVMIYDGSKTLSRTRRLVDEETGEIFYEEHAAFVRQRERPHGSDFIKLYRVNIVDMLQRIKLSIGAKALLFDCITLLNWQDNYVVDPESKARLGIAALAKIAGHTHQQVGRWLKELEKHGLVILEEAQRGAPVHILLNTNLAFRGRRIIDVEQVNRSDKTRFEPKRREKLKEVVKIQDA